jgi:HD-like signal output (HDOD) protein
MRASTVQLQTRTALASASATGIPWAHFRIPPFPSVALRVLECVDDDGISMCHLMDLISSDPAFCAEVLTIANSPLIPHRLPVTSILRAVTVLGTQRIKGLCLTVAVRSYLGKSLNYPALRAIWRHSLATAVIAEQLSHFGLIDENDAFTAGLMHEIGRFALAVVRPREYAALLDSHIGPAKSILPREREIFGYDHCEIGQQLVVEWGLPDHFDAVVRPKKRLWGATDTSSADGLHVSCRLADTAGFPAFPGCEVTLFPDLMSEIPDRQRLRFYPTIDEMTADLQTRIKAIESL